MGACWLITVSFFPTRHLLMDDGIVINLATDDFVVPRKSTAQKGGRWTDR